MGTSLLAILNDSEVSVKPVAIQFSGDSGNDFFVVRGIEIKRVGQPVQRIEFRLPYGDFPVLMVRIFAD